MESQDDRHSSPDPLTLSWNNSHAIRPSVSPSKRGSNLSPQKPKRARKSSVNKVAGSPRTQRQTLIFTTPTKDVGKKKRVDSSPWRIKVTVETEPEDIAQDNGTPQTKTTRVPLRGGDEHGNVIRKSSKARSPGARVSSNSTTPKPLTRTKRSGTSSAKRKHSPDSSVHVVEEGEIGNDASDLIALDTPYSTTAPSSKRKKNEISGQARHKAQKANLVQTTPLHEKPQYAHLAQSRFELDCTPFGEQGEPSVRRRLRERVPTPMKPAGFDESQLSPMPESSPAASHSQIEVGDPQERLLFAATLGPTGHDDVEQELELRSDVEGDADVYDLEDDTRVLDQSLVESEGFTMVSIGSLESQGQKKCQSETQPVVGTAVGETLKLDAIAGYTTDERPSENEGITYSNSGTAKISRLRSVQKINSDSNDESCPTFGAQRSSNDPLPFQRADTATSQVCNPFGAFGNGTRRELGAGLAMGELLARSEHEFVKHRFFNQDAVSNNYNSIHGSATQFTTRSQAEGRLPTPSDTASSPGASIQQSDAEGKGPGLLNAKFNDNSKFNDQLRDPVPRTQADIMSWRPTTPTKLTRQSSELTQTQESERHWQLEKEEVSRQANSSNSGHSAYVKSSNPPSCPGEVTEQGDMDMHGFTDIWQEEAERSLEEFSELNSSRRLADTETACRDRPHDLRELLGEDTRPLRSKLPRTWRRNSGNHFLYSDEAESPIRPVVRLDQVDDKSRGNDLNFGSHEAQQGKQQAQNGKEEIALKSILSSPEKRLCEFGNTPKQLRFKKSTTELDRDNEGFTDAQYFSSEHSEDENTIETREGIKNAQSYTVVSPRRSVIDKEYSPDTRHHGHPENAQKTNGLSQLQMNLKILATPNSRTLISDPQHETENPPQDSRAMLALNLHSENNYQNLFGDASLRNNSHESPKHQKADANRERHIESSKTIIIEASPKAESSHPQGIFRRLASWLYPPIPTPEPRFSYTFDWDRNHYLVLNSYWERYFQPPHFVEPLPLARWPDERPLTSDFERFVGARITRFGGEQPLIITKIHCQLAAGFVAELGNCGLPLLCDGRRKVPRHIRRQAPDYDPAEDSSEEENEKGDEWPKRDASGRILRRKQQWTTEETLKGVYGLWLIKMHSAERMRLLEKKQRRAARKKRRESNKASCKTA